MHTEIEYLKILAIEIAAKPRHEDDAKIPDKYLVVEANRLQNYLTNHLLKIDNFPQREIFYFNTIEKLVDVCDILYARRQAINPDVQVLLDLLTEVKNVLPSEISPRLKIPQAFIHLQKMKFAEFCNEKHAVLKIQQVDPNLILLVTIPFDHFINSKNKLYWRDFTWLKGFQEKLNNVDWENADCNSKTEALISVLLNCNFNDDRFFIYCKRYIKERTNKYGTKKRRLVEFAECQKLILQDTLDGFPLYNHRLLGISDKLIEWIGIETKNIVANDDFYEQDYKIEFNIDGESLSVFFKHLMEHGITKQVNLDLYAKQIAATCSSKDTPELKWTTIKSKFHLKKPEYLKRIFFPLVAMVEDIKRFLKL
jgi:hypothetical protein